MLLLLVAIFSVSLGKVISTDQEALSQSCLKAHNEYRTRHGAPPLKWSGELAEEAQNWANHLAVIDQMERDATTNEGENIFYMYGGDPSEACDRAVENWYSEVKNYDFKKPQENLSADHFSQVVGKTTKELGVGTAKSKSGNFFLVARYNPKGDADVLLTLDQGEAQDTVNDKPREAPQTLNDAAHNLDDNASSTPLVTITTTESSDPSVPKTTANLSESSAVDNQPQSSSSIFKNNMNKTVDPGKEVPTESPMNRKHGNNNSNFSSHDNTSPDFPTKADNTKEMKIKPPKIGKDVRVELRFPNIKYTEKMAYTSSKEFEKFRIEITSAILQLYEDDDDFQEVQLLSLRNGSVVATLGFIFAKEGPDHLDKLTSAVAMGKLGELDMSRDYVSADALPNEYLKLTLPHQPSLYSQCPQPCSSPNHCFPTGCHVTCCSFHPTSVTPPVHNTDPKPIPPPACPSNCDSSCLPQCTTECCWNKQPGLQQDAPQPDITQQAQQLEVKQPEVKQPDVSKQEINQTNQGYSCPATCPFACYPQCTPDCCSTQAPGYFVKPNCSDYCADICSVSCPQECCEVRKSNIHNMKQSARFTGSKVLLPPLVNAKLPYMHNSKVGAARNPIYGKGFKDDSNVQYSLKLLQAFINKIAPYKKPTSTYIKEKQSLAFRTQSGSSRNPLSFRRKTLYSRPEFQRKSLYKNAPARRLQATKTFNTPIFNKASYSTQTNPGMQAIKDLQSKGAPLDIRFAYRYGNRLLVPIDLPNMDIKELRGKKFISVPAFKRTTKK